MSRIWTGTDLKQKSTKQVLYKLLCMLTVGSVFRALIRECQNFQLNLQGEILAMEMRTFSLSFSRQRLNRSRSTLSGRLSQ